MPKATKRYLESGLTKKNGQSLLAVETVEDLNSRATQKLNELIVRRSKRPATGDLDQAELIAARELLDRSK